THPGTGSRIAHAETLLSNYIPPKDKAKCAEDLRFDMVKYRLLGLYAGIEPTLNLLTNQLNDSPSTAAIHYGLGLIYDRKFMKDKAMAHFKTALSIAVFDPMVLLEMGRVYLENSEPQKALNVLNGIESDPVIGLMAKFYQAGAYLELENLATAKELFTLVIDKAPALYPKAYYNLAAILSLEKKQGLSHYYLGIYYSKINNTKTAIVHLNKALDLLTDDADIQKTKDLLNELNETLKKRS
ncbi:MAG: Zn-dependent protease, partial [Proteobacteria bacterium]|nr:Zn-dependent protease [Pseudomonadota bacterium]